MQSSTLSAFSLLSFASALHAQGSLVGSVISDPGEKPLPNAEVIVMDLKRTVRSDSLGAFRLTNVPAGTHQIVVRLTGYEPWKGVLRFRDGQPIEADFVLQALATPLAGVQVNAPASSIDPRLADFEARRKSGGGGHFLTAEVFEKTGGRALSDVLLERIPGLKAAGNTNEKVLSSLHDGAIRCAVQVILNGSAVFTGAPGQPTFNINSILGEDVIGFEYYTVAATPIRYMGTGARSNNDNPQGPPCGTAIIWTK